MPNFDGTGPAGRGFGMGKGPCGRGRGFGAGIGRGMGRRIGPCFNSPVSEVALSKEDERKIIAARLEDLGAEKKELEEKLKEL
ncbi:MAG: DUF5320 family protein [archaeon]